MALDIFSSHRGMVSACTTFGVAMRILISNWPDYYSFKNIITGITFNSENATQFLHSLGDFIYIYSFGERISDLTISGISFPLLCENYSYSYDQNGINSLTPDLQPHGMELLLYYYNIMRASNNPYPIGVVLGVGTVFWGFLTNVTVDLNNPENLTSTFKLSLKCIPSNSTLDQYL